MNVQLYTVCVQCPKRLGEGGRCSGTTTDCYESSCRCWEPDLGPLTTEPPLHSPEVNFFKTPLFIEALLFHASCIWVCTVSFYIFLSGPWGYREQCSCSPASEVPSRDPSTLCSALRCCGREMVLCDPGENSSIRVRWLKRAGLSPGLERDKASRLQASCLHSFRERLRVGSKKLRHYRNESRNHKIHTSSFQILSLGRSDLLNCLQCSMYLPLR